MALSHFRYCWSASKTSLSSSFSIKIDFATSIKSEPEPHFRSFTTCDIIKEIKSFVVGIERDYDAVRAGLSVPWSHNYVA